MDATYQARIIINNNHIDSDKNEAVEILSPWTNKVIGTTQSASEVQVDEAFLAAEKAFTTWKYSNISDRVDVLYKVIDLLKSNSAEISMMLSKEIGKFEKDAQSEVSRSIGYIQLVIDAMRTMKGSIYYGDIFNKYPRRRKTGYYDRVPLGVILAISPFNYPINLSVTKVIPALISGNTVVLKPPKQGSLTTHMFYKLFMNAGLPAGVLNLISGKASEIGDKLTTHSSVKLIAFTGSTKVGNHIGAISKGVPLLMELGGKDIGVVSNKADLDMAVEQILHGAFSYCGQRCTAQKSVIVYEKVADEFRDKVTNAAQNLEVNPMIDGGSADYVQELIDDAIKCGADHVLQGSREGNLIKPNIFDKVTQKMRLFSEEQFGPVLPIIRASEEEEAVKIASMSQYGLQGSVYTNDIEEAFRIADKLDVGTVQINGRPDRGPDHFPFGGTNDSGQLMQGTIETINLMTRGKLTVLNLHKFS